MQEEIEQMVSERLGPPSFQFSANVAKVTGRNTLLTGLGENSRCREGSTTCALRMM